MTKQKSSNLRAYISIVICGLFLNYVNIQETLANSPTTTAEKETKSQFYCKKYAKQAYSSATNKANATQCLKSSSNQFEGSTLAKAGEFPHMALIGYGNASDINWSCIGNLISDQWVLTTAGCAKNVYDEAQFVRLGELTRRKEIDKTKTQDFTVIQLNQHIKYIDALMEFNFYDDIALLKLNKKVKFTPYVMPACLYNDYKINQTKAISAGWSSRSDGRLNESLVKHTLKWSSFEKCNQTFKNLISLTRFKGIVDATQFCVESSSDDLCRAEISMSGIAVQIDTEPEIYCMNYIVGLMSFHKSPCTVFTPYACTRISAYIPSIERAVWPDPEL